MSVKEKVERIRTRALNAEYFLDPLESEILGRPVAQLRNVEVFDGRRALKDLQRFFDWCARRQVSLCSCRLPQTQRNEAMLLENGGFRWIELNFHPELNDLQERNLRNGDIRVAEAEIGDRNLLGEMAADAFDFGRFHQDPRLGPAIGKRRYRHWLENAFEAHHQHVLKCIFNGETIGFFVIERPNGQEIFWSLIGLGRSWWGRGLGRRAWEAVLLHHQQHGVRRIATSISSHNVPAFNLYVRLGWRFPPPLLTFHWCSSTGLLG